MRRVPNIFFAIALLLVSLPALAHVGSPDVYFEGQAGPYPVLVVIRPPAVVPGVAQIQVRSLNGGVSRIEILPLTMQGPGASLAPRPDAMQRSSADPQLYNGNLWIMLRGSWKVQVQVEGAQGKAEVDVPVAAVSMTAARMGVGMGAMLGSLGLLLFIGLISIVRSSNGQALLAPHEAVTPSLKRRSIIGTIVGALVVITVLVLGWLWWGLEARANDRMVYRVPHLDASLQAGNLQVKLENPNARSFVERDWMAFWAQTLNTTDLVPDHGHIMHLFLVRMPDMRSFWHLHPATTDFKDFSAKVPAIPEGHYEIYADVVHSTGFPETQIGSIDLPAVAGQPLQGDDSGGGLLAATSGNIAQLSDGYRMLWQRDQPPLHAQQAMVFHFRVEDANGQPATDLENYMGMAAHAVFMSNDGKVFAHIHPEGSVSMAALSMAQAPVNPAATMAGMNMPVPADVSFPYGFPQAGDYHLFVQVKRAGRVETGVFTVHVLP